MAWNFAHELERYGPGAVIPPMTKAEASSYCESVAKSHYENFTVASWFLPKALRPHFHAVYAYCRWADDLADETGGGEASLRLLEWWRGELLDNHPTPPTPLPPGERGVNRHPVMIALQETIRTFRIPLDPFLNLITAFEQDQRVKEYETFDQLLGYCANSANPVGRIVLYLFECYGEERAKLSDEICTGLQLANFWQDVARDLAIGRIYLPREDRDRFGVHDLKRTTPAFRELLKFQVERTRSFFESGKPLLKMVPHQCRIDLDLFLRGGEAILHAIEKQNYNVLTSRPVVGKWAKIRLLMRALIARVLP